MLLISSFHLLSIETFSLTYKGVFLTVLPSLNNKLKIFHTCPSLLSIKLKMIPDSPNVTGINSLSKF